MDIILYLLNYINYQRKIIGQLLNFICRYIPLKQWAFDDSHSPKYQKFKVVKLPKIISYQQDWTWKDLIPYYPCKLRSVLTKDCTGTQRYPWNQDLTSAGSELLYYCRYLCKTFYRQLRLQCWQSFNCR